MKKLLALLLAAMMLFSLAACDLGNNETPNDDTPDTSQTDNQGGSENNNGESNTDKSNQNNESPNDNSGDTVKTTLADVLKVYGLSEDDFKPNGFKELSAYTLNGTAGGIQSMLIFSVSVDGEPTVDNTKVWYGDLYSRLTGLSDTGKLYSDMQGAQEIASLDEILNASQTLTGHPAFTCYYPCPIGKNRTYLQFKVNYEPDDNTYSVWIWVMNYLR